MQLGTFTAWLPASENSASGSDSTVSLLWGGGGHLICTCPHSSKRPGSLERGVLVSRANITPHPAKPNSLFPVSLSWGLENLSVGALVDLGADECLMDVTLARQARVPLDTSLSAQALDGRTLGKISHCTIPISLTISGNHTEKIQFLIIRAPTAPLVLGRL